MLFTLRCAHFMIYFSSLVVFIKSQNERGLSFNQINHALLDITKIRKTNMKEIGAPIAIACPVFSNDEKEFNTKYSRGNNSLFVESTFEEFTHPAYINEKICNNRYKMSVIFNIDSEEFEFGYEVYCPLAKSSNFKTSNYLLYDSIINYDVFPLKRRLARMFKNSKLLLGGKKELKFTWILSFTLKFNKGTKSLTQIKYSMSKAIQTGFRCEDHKLGEEFYTKHELDVDLLYSDTNQIKVFENVKIPTSESEDEYKEAACKSGNECLMKWRLIPADHFRFRSPKPLSCSNLVTVPIWTSIAEGVLYKLDKFLYALTKITDEMLQVLSGVHGVLEMPTKNGLNTKKITLRDNGEIPVPNVIFKIVEYELTISRKNGSGKEERFSASTAVIVVIHNDPYFKKEDKICEDSVCVGWGWKEILYENFSSEATQSKYIYCCPKNNENAGKLGVLHEGRESDALNLKLFPRYDHEARIILQEDIENDVIQKMGELFDKKNNSKLNDEEMTRKGVETELVTKDDMEERELTR